MASNYAVAASEEILYILMTEADERNRDSICAAIDRAIDAAVPARSPVSEVCVVFEVEVESTRIHGVFGSMEEAVKAQLFLGGNHSGVYVERRPVIGDFVAWRDEQIRKRALAKLEPEERRLLGLSEPEE